MLALLLMCLFLGLASFGAGTLPLMFPFSRDSISKLSMVGTGILLGTALGVIIPEGIESVIKNSRLSSTEAEEHHDDMPISTIAFSLLVGFAFMLIVEQLMSPHSHSIPGIGNKSVSLEGGSNGANDLVFDVAELGEVSGSSQAQTPAPPASASATTMNFSDVKKRAVPLTFGLILHALADGLALGVSSVPFTSDHEGEENSPTLGLSLVVFSALVIHKAPTALALSTQLLNQNLPRKECRLHLMIFAASTPIGAIVSYLFFAFFFGGGSVGEKWAGVALLLSGGTFLYVATVLQPVSASSADLASERMSEVVRVSLMVIGIFFPFIITTIFGHGH